MSALKQIEKDKKLISLDGTNIKSKLGANAILDESLAVAQSCSYYFKILSIIILEVLMLKF